MNTMNKLNSMNAIKTSKHTRRVEEYPTIMQSNVHKSENKPNKIKRDCKALPNDGINGNQVKKLSKNTAKKRKRAQQLESIICGQEMYGKSEIILESPNNSSVAIGGSQNSVNYSHDINMSSRQHLLNVNIHANCGEIERNNVIPCKDDSKRFQQNSTVPKIKDLVVEKCVLNEIDENLFNLDRDIALAHCVAEDLRMEGGVAVQFKRYFGGIGQLIDQNLKVGDVGVIVNHRNENAFYLVTKKYTNSQPTILSLSDTLKSLLVKMKEMKLTKLAIPRIGCGIDGLDWFKVKSLIADIFAGSGINITVCVPSKIFYRQSPPQLKVFVTPKKILDIADKISDLVLFIDLEQAKTNNLTNCFIDDINSRYPSFKEKLLNDIKNKTLNAGDVTKYFINKEWINCVFTSETGYYSSLEKGFIAMNIYKSYRNFAIQCGPIKPVDSFKHVSRTVLILRSIVYGSELWLCGNTGQCNEKDIYEHYCKTVHNELRYSKKPENRNNNKSSDQVHQKGKSLSPPKKYLR